MTDQTLEEMNAQLANPMYDFEAHDALIKLRQKALAESMRQQAQNPLGSTPMPQGQMVSGHYVAPHWSQQLAAAINPILQQQNTRLEEQHLNRLMKEYGVKDRAWAQQILQALGPPPPRQATQAETQGPATETGTPPVSVGTVQPPAPSGNERLQILQQGMAVPSLRDTVTKAFQDQIVQEPIRAEARAEKALARSDRAAELEQARIDRGDQLAQDRVERAAVADQRSKDTRLSIEQRREAAHEHAQLMGTLAGNRGPLLQVQDENGNITYVPRSQAAGLKPPERFTAGQQAAIASNNSAIAAIDDAIASIKANPNSVGKKGVIPDIALQRLDPEGVSTRAKVANIGSLKLHDRTGAVVAINEAPRLMPFIPGVSDTDESAIKKLQDLKAEYVRNQDAAAVAPRNTGNFGPGPTVVATKVIDGVTYVNDGKGWKPQ